MRNVVGAIVKAKSKANKSPYVTVELRLYVAGRTARSVAAISNLKKICSEHLEARFHVEVIDLAKTPVLASDHKILAIPTLVRKLPVPIRKIIGDLSNTERVLVGHDLRDSKSQE